MREPVLCCTHTSQTTLPPYGLWVGAAEDSVLMFDVDLVDLVAKLAPKLHTVKTYIVLTDRGNMHRAVTPPIHTTTYKIGCADIQCPSTDYSER